MAASRSWYVQVMFGVILGPMPNDALAEMVRSGSLLGSDLVRAAGEQDWIPVSQLPEFEGWTQLESDRICSAVESETDEFGHMGNVPHEFPQAAETELDAFPQLAAWKSERERKLRANEPTALEIEIEQSAADLPIECHPAVAASDDQSGNESSNRRAWLKVTRVKRAITADKVDAANRFSWLQLRIPNRWRVVAAVLLAVGCLIWVWPRSHRNVRQRLVAIHQELASRRNDSKDNEAFQAFVSRASRELDGQIAWLERHADSRDAELPTLLQASRDCLRPMLKSPRKWNERLEAKFVFLLKSLGQLESDRGPGGPGHLPGHVEQNSPAATVDEPNSVTPDLVDPTFPTDA